jgi:hypothetical protein
LIQKIAVIVMLDRDQKDSHRARGRLRVTIGTQSLLEGDLDIDFGPNTRLRVLMGFQGLIVPATGDLIFSFLVDGRQVASTSLPVVQKGTPVGQSVPVMAGGAATV